MGAQTLRNASARAWSNACPVFFLGAVAPGDAKGGGVFYQQNARCSWVFMGLWWDLDGIEISISCAKSVEITPSYYDLLICDDVSKVHGATNL